MRQFQWNTEWNRIEDRTGVLSGGIKSVITVSLMHVKLRVKGKHRAGADQTAGQEQFL